MKQRRKAKPFLIQIRPDERRIVGFHPDTISPGTLQRILKTRQVANRELCYLKGIGVLRYARAHRSPAENELLPRWQLGAADAVAGFAILFGLNTQGKAASCPVDVDFVERNITWLASIEDTRATMLDVQANLDRLAAGDPQQA